MFELQHAAVFRMELHLGAALGDAVPHLPHPVAAHARSRGHPRAGEVHTDEKGGTSGPEREGALAAPTELVSVSPRRELRAHRPPDAHQFQPLLVTGEPHIFGRDAQLRVTEEPLAHLDRFPALFDRREVPALTLAAHDPETASLGVEGESAPDREVLDHLVRSEGFVAEHAGAVHRGSRAGGAVARQDSWRIRVGREPPSMVGGAPASVAH